MSYDFPDGYVPPPRKRSLWNWLVGRYWSFILWCALDAKSDRINQWAQKRLTRKT